MEDLIEKLFHISEKSAFSDFLFKNYRFNRGVKWFHVVYFQIEDEFRILHLRASSRNDLNIPTIDFKSRLDALPEISENELLFFLGTYGRFENPLPSNPNVDWGTMLEEVKTIVIPTKGYVLFKEQAMEWYSYFTGANSGQAFRWMEKWNKKKGNVRENHLFKDSPGNEVDLIQFFPVEEMGSFFLNKPLSETYFLLQALHEEYWDKTIIEGKFKAEYLGDLFYEEGREKETIEGIAYLIETNNGLLRLKLFADFPKLGIRETWEFGLNYSYESYPWLDYMELEIIELGDQDYLIQLSPFRRVLGEDYFDDFMVKVQFETFIITK